MKIRTMYGAQKWLNWKLCCCAISLSFTTRTWWKNFLTNFANTPWYEQSSMSSMVLTFPEPFVNKKKEKRNSSVCAKFSILLRGTHFIFFFFYLGLGCAETADRITEVCVSGSRREGRVGCLQIQTLRFRERHRQWLEGKINGSSIARREL